jgi:hypothetical protein
MGLSCRCQTLPKGSPGRPCDKCKARNKTRDAKAKASGAHQQAVQKYRRSDKGRLVQHKKRGAHRLHEQHMRSFGQTAKA